MLALHKDITMLTTLSKMLLHTRATFLFIIKSAKMLTRKYGISLINLNLFLHRQQKTKKSGLIKKDIPTLIVCETCDDVSCCKF